MAGIGFFAPLPLALMLPFMAGQSMLMGDAFGKSYQYGKRKISAMSNEEFNALTPDDLAKDITADFNALIPELKVAMAASTEFQGQIIRELGQMLQDFINDLSPNVKSFILGLANFDQSQTGPPGPPTPPPPPGTPPQGTLPVNPTATYDWPAWITRALSGLNIAANNYNILKGNLENFFRGVTDFNDMVLRDAQKIVDDFIDNLLPEQAPHPRIGNPPPPQAPRQGKTYHPSYVRQLQSLLNNKSALVVQLSDKQAEEKISFNLFQEATTNAVKNAEGTRLANIRREISVLENQIAVIDRTMAEFIIKFTPERNI